VEEQSKLSVFQFDAKDFGKLSLFSSIAEEDNGKRRFFSSQLFISPLKSAGELDNTIKFLEATPFNEYPDSGFIGSAALWNDTRQYDILTLWDLRVDKAFRGHGLGQVLLRAAGGIARENRFKQIAADVMVDEKIHDRLRFYRRLGFTVKKTGIFEHIISNPTISTDLRKNKSLDYEFIPDFEKIQVIK
jgi:GNAT superfamily N-acetyltransferase